VTMLTGTNNHATVMSSY